MQDNYFLYIIRLFKYIKGMKTKTKMNKIYKQVLRVKMMGDKKGLDGFCDSEFTSIKNIKYKDFNTYTTPLNCGVTIKW